MRLAAITIATILGISSPAFAYENFIPLGHNYAPDDPALPAFGSDQDKLNALIDIHESEIYNSQRRAKVFRSQLERFRNDQEYRAGSDFIDY